MSSTNKNFFIATVLLVQLDETATESGDLVLFNLPVIAKNHAEATKAAATFNSEGGDAVLYHDPVDHFCATTNARHTIIAECQERDRWLTWKVTKCTPVTEDDFNLYVNVSKRLGNHRICTDIHNRHVYYGTNG